MKIGLISSTVPLARGGGRFIVDWLRDNLIARGFPCEAVYIPFTEELDHILPQIAAIRLMKLDDYFDRVITFRPPAHMVRHPNKVIWFIHHLRGFYDLWQTPYCAVIDDVSGRALRDSIVEADNMGLAEAKFVFTNSRIVGDRLRRFNQVESTVLYPPVARPEMFRAGEYGDEIVCVCRMEHHKRQHLLVEAMAHTRTAVRLRLCGPTMTTEYVTELTELVQRLGLQDRIVIEARWISEEEKYNRLEGALAAVYVPFDEDSYGYPTIEAAHARRCTLTVSDAGGVPEFVVHGVNGEIATPEPIAVAQMFDRLFVDRTAARRMGEAALLRIMQLGIDWDTVVSRLIA
jgi:glycosyltransferase involved in cell wall biosynthesis